MLPNPRHQEWERETENCLSLFQDLEEGRIALLRDSLWKVTNIVSSHSVVDDSGSEQARRRQEGRNMWQFEKCNIRFRF